MSNEDIGFRPLVTRATVLKSLMASPTEYDAAPTYMVSEYKEKGSELRRELGLKMAAELTSKADTTTFKQQVMVAVELAAPVGFGMVRVAALTSQVGKLVLVANPVVAVLTAPALFFTARRTLRDIKRALFVDQEVRELTQRSQELAERGDLRGAEALLKEALKKDINPDYPRNGDLYLALGMTQMADARAREAMVSFAKASVLFPESASYTFTKENGQSGKISKRGLTELLACSAIDAFAKDEKGILEWQAVLDDFSESAGLRLDGFASSLEKSFMQKLVNKHAEGIEIGRELAAKAGFLSAKMRLRSVGFTDHPDIEKLLEEALYELKNSELETEELFSAILEQAQFYCDVALRHSDESPVHAHRAVKLLIEAAKVIEVEDPVQATRVRAEAASFAMQLIPHAVAGGGDVALLTTETRQLLLGLDEELDSNEVHAPFSEVVHGWVREQQYRLMDSREARTDAATRMYDAYMAADEPVAAMYSAIRLAYAVEEEEERSRALKLLIAAAHKVLGQEFDPVSQAFAAKYLLDASEMAGVAGQEYNRAKSAEMFGEAANWVRAEKAYVPFYLHGAPVIHEYNEAFLVLTGHRAIELAKGGETDIAISDLESVRARLFDAAPKVEMALELEYAQILMIAEHEDAAREVLETVEKRARRDDDMSTHRRALDLLHQLIKKTAEEVSGHPTRVIAPAAEGFLGEFESEKNALLSIASEASAVMAPVSHLANLRERLEARLARVEEEKFRVGIVGEFSAGKSTFLNALIGSNVLPASVRPTTATVTRLSWAAEPSCDVEFQDGTIEGIELGQLKSYATERGNPKNEKSIKEIRIGYPLEVLARGVEFIDTPGVSSLIGAHTQTTYDLIPSCDAVILLATGRQPFSESIGDFLRDLKTFVEGRVFYVLNKIDQLDANGVPVAIQFAQDKVADKIHGAVVVPLASYQAGVGRRLVSGEASAQRQL